MRPFFSILFSLMLLVSFSASASPPGFTDNHQTCISHDVGWYMVIISVNTNVSAEIQRPELTWQVSPGPDIGSVFVINFNEGIAATYRYRKQKFVSYSKQENNRRKHSMGKNDDIDRSTVIEYFVPPIEEGRDIDRPAWQWQESIVKDQS